METHTKRMDHLIDPLFRLPFCLALPKKYWVCASWVQLATRTTNLTHGILCFVPKLNSEKNKGLWAERVFWWQLVAVSSLPPGLPFLHPLTQLSCIICRNKAIHSSASRTVLPHCEHLFSSGLPWCRCELDVQLFTATCISRTQQHVEFAGRESS